MALYVTSRVLCISAVIASSAFWSHASADEPVRTTVAAPLPAPPSDITLQWSFRNAIGGGFTRVGRQYKSRFDWTLRWDALFGPDRADAFRAGPILTLRTSDFSEGQAALGGEVLLPVLSGFPLALHAGAGARTDWRGNYNPLVLVGAAFGYRAYNYGDSYGYSFNLYADTFFDPSRPSEVSFVAGVELDLVFLVAIPAAFIWNWATEGDPEEPQ